MSDGMTIMTMNMSASKRVGVVLVMAALVAFAAGAAEQDEFYVNTYRSIGTVSPRGVRSNAMGRTGRGLADGVSSLGVNPAALGAFTGSSVEGGLGYDWLDDGYDDVDQVTFRLGGAVNLERWNPCSGPNQAVGGLIYTENYSGAANVSMKREQTGVLMAYGLHLMDNLLGGISVALFDGKWNSSQQMTSAGTLNPYYLDRKFIGGDFRVGGLYRLSDETTLGGTLEYATGSFKEKAEYASGAGSGSINRYNLGFGVAHQYTEDTMVMGDIWYDNLRTDVPGVLKERNKAWGIGAGVEQKVIPEVMALRGGLYYDRTSYSSSGRASSAVGPRSYSKGRFGMTAGVGVKLYNFDVGYSLDVNTGGDVKNLLDVSAEW